MKNTARRAQRQQQKELGEEVQELRRSVVERELHPTRWISKTVAEFTCPRGHEHSWCYIDKGIHLACPGGAERACYSDLCLLANSIREELEQEGDDLCDVRAVEDPQQAAQFEELVTITKVARLRTLPRFLSEPKTVADLVAISPVPVASIPVKKHWKVLLECLYIGCHWQDRLWIGHPWETGAEHRDHFQPFKKWMALPEQSAIGPQLYLGQLRPYVCDRVAENLRCQIYYNAEGDKLALNEQATVLWHLIDQWSSQLKPAGRGGTTSICAITFSGNKSLHALMLPWPSHPGQEPFIRRPDAVCHSFDRLKAMLGGLRFDMNNFRVGGMARCPGWFRKDEKVPHGSWQRLIYLAPPFRPIAVKFGAEAEAK